MEDLVLNRLKALIASCPHLDEKLPLLVDYTYEDRPCYGIFPAGEQRLSADIGGNERWQYRFTIQMTGYALEERERIENQGFGERFSRWASCLRAEDVPWTDPFRFESLWAGGSSLLYPAQDGQTFVYQLEGLLCYRRMASAFFKPSSGQWFFALGPAEEAVWMSGGTGLSTVTEENLDETSPFVDWLGRIRGLSRGVRRKIMLEGELIPDDRFQKTMLALGGAAEGRWAFCADPPTEGDAPAVGGGCSLRALARSGKTPSEPGRFTLELFVFDQSDGLYWRDKYGAGGFLPFSE